MNVNSFVLRRASSVLHYVQVVYCHLSNKRIYDDDVNATLAAEAYISTVWRRGSLVFSYVRNYLVLFSSCFSVRTSQSMHSKYHLVTCAENMWTFILNLQSFLVRLAS